MRDIALVAFVLGTLPLILVRPYVGVLVWAWLGYMNPHRLTFGFAYDFPFAFLVAITTLVAALFAKELKRIRMTGLTIMWLCFVAWMGITTVFALYPHEALVQYEKVLKIQLMTFVTISVMGSRERLRMLIWVIVVSLAYYGVKGGIFTIVNGGNFRVYGPPESFVEGNNEIALALLMILPLMHYLRTTSQSKWVRMGLLASMILCGFAIVGSQSRGAFVGGIAMALFLGIKAKHKVAAGAILLLLVSLLFSFMPEQWHERMRTIETYEADASAMGRVETWRMAFNLANDKPLGGGFELWTADVFQKYYPEKKAANDAHSIYFKVLAEHGWFGFFLFLGIGIAAWRSGSQIIRVCGNRPDLEWLSSLARMVHVSLAAYAAGGAFLGLSYFDLYWHLVAILVIGRELVRQQELRGAKLTTRRPAPVAPYTDRSASR